MHLTTIGNSLYATGQTNIWKLEQNLTILNQYIGATGTTHIYCRGIYFNSTSNFIYISAYNFNVIDVFYFNLSLSHNISTSTYQPFSIVEYNNQMYVWTTTGEILVIVNELLLMC